MVNFGQSRVVLSLNFMASVEEPLLESLALLHLLVRLVELKVQVADRAAQLVPVEAFSSRHRLEVVAFNLFLQLTELLLVEDLGRVVQQRGHDF